MNTSKISIEPEKKELWYGRKEKNNPESNLVVRMEEFRTIMGYTVKVTKNSEEIYVPEETQNGDDLCENLYRICVGIDLRYGHIIKPNQIISQEIINRIQTTCRRTLEIGKYKEVKS